MVLSVRNIYSFLCEHKKHCQFALGPSFFYLLHDFEQRKSGSAFIIRGHSRRTGRRIRGRISADASGRQAASRTCHSGRPARLPDALRRTLSRICRCSPRRRSKSSPPRASARASSRRTPVRIFRSPSRRRHISKRSRSAEPARPAAEPAARPSGTAAPRSRRRPAGPCSCP